MLWSAAASAMTKTQGEHTMVTVHGPPMISISDARNSEFRNYALTLLNVNEIHQVL